ncbi:pitrilysin family protein [Flavobacterium sp. 14A]|uniref:M16 family metallopeptidase n=1 Tax=Flavobacterium sp. 14A TaxID=2735896 RepID=UPI00156FB240|nr:pitrilysin family protein [Flavobacterium sp. 14A]NRT11839.1 putative Zn-dependent peptidase [Flavobacterium sp. 14A]
MKNKTHNITVLLVFILTVTNAIAQGYSLPKYTTFKLSNGLTVNLMEQHDVPLISIVAVVPAGAIYDGEQAGLASLTATALKHGTTNYTRSAIDEELDFIGANIYTAAYKEFSRVTADFAAKDQKKVLAIFKEILLNPTFNEEEFAKEKSRMLVGLEQQKESPKNVIGSYFDKQLYGNHVYGTINSGITTTVEKLSVADVKKFYSANYTATNSAITIVGDFATADMKKSITALFSSWKKETKEKEDLANAKIEKPTSAHVLLINKDDANETTFYIGSTGISRNNPDFVAIDVVNTLFGGRFTSMLNDELRVNTGLTYGASSSFNSYKNGGSFVISTFTNVKTTEAALDKAVEVLRTLHEKGISEQNLNSAKNYVKGQFPPEYETSGQLASLLSQMFWYKLDRSFIDDFEKNVDSIDLAKANKIIATYFPKDNLQFTIVGKASEIRKIVSKYGTVTEVNISDDPKM